MTDDRPLKCFLSYGAVQRGEVDVILTLLQQLDVDTFTGPNAPRADQKQPDKPAPIMGTGGTKPPRLTTSPPATLG